MQDVATHAKRIAVRSVAQVVPKTPEPGRVEEAVAVDDEHPGRGPDVLLEVAMRVAGVRRPPELDVLERRGGYGCVREFCDAVWNAKRAVAA